MRMDKLTSRFQQAIADAQSLAVGRDHNVIEPVHLMVALLDQQGGGTRPLLAQSGVNVPVLRERLAELEADKKAVKNQIHESSAEIRKRAQQTMREVREIAGLPTLRS